MAVKSNGNVLLWTLAIIAVLTAASAAYLYSVKGGELRARAEVQTTTTPKQGEPDYAQQIEIYQSLLQRNPADISAHIGLAEVYYLQERYKEGIDSYRRALRLDPVNTDYHIDLSLGYLYLGMPDMGSRYARRATELDAKNQRAWLVLGFIEESRQRRSTAMEAWRKTVEINPSSSLAKEAQQFLDQAGAQGASPQGGMGGGR